MTTSSRSLFVHGVEVGGCAGALVISYYFMLYAPTNDIRSRLPLLLGAYGGLGALYSLCEFLAATGVCLFLVGGWNPAALKGGALAAGAWLWIQISGWPLSLIPEFTSARSRYVVFLTTASLCALFLLWQRVQLARLKSASKSPPMS